MMQYPIISEYEVEIKKRGTAVLNLPDSYEFIPNRTVPIKFFNFGSGAFAGIFKIRNVANNKVYALRCFLSGGDPKNIERSVCISEYLQHIDDLWLCKNTFYKHGITVKGHTFPVILMEWSSGQQINDYVSSIIADNNKLTALQRKIIDLNLSLENQKIAHGDIQSGNLLVEENNGDINLKLVDYDPMYIPTMVGLQSLEIGHSSFQHSKRTKSDYNEKIDRFSFWLLLTAIEALKFDKTLWNKDLRGGFNDEDNFLFKAKDISNPQSSQLVGKLRALNQKSVNFYLDNLFSNSFSPDRELPSIFIDDTVSESVAFESPKPKPIVPTQESKNDENFLIESVPSVANVYYHNSGTKTHLGVTPLQLNMDDFASKQIFVASNGLEKTFYLNRNEKNYKIDFTLSKSIPSPYHFYINGKLQPLTLEQFEEEIKRGTIFEKVYINGREFPVIVDKKLQNILNKYGVTIQEPLKTPPPYTPPSTNESKTSVYVLVGILLFFALIWVLVSIFENSNTSSAETPPTIENNKYPVLDSSASIIDTAASYVEPGSNANISSNNTIAPSNVSQKLRAAGINTFNDYSSVKPTYDGCGSYFSLSKADYEKEELIFTGMVSSYFFGSSSPLYGTLSMVIDGKVIFFTSVEISKGGNYMFLGRDDMILEIDLKQIGSGEEVITYEGEMMLKKTVLNINFRYMVKVAVEIY